MFLSDWWAHLQQPGWVSEEAKVGSREPQGDRPAHSPCPTLTYLFSLSSFPFVFISVSTRQCSILKEGPNHLSHKLPIGTALARAPWPGFQTAQLDLQLQEHGDPPLNLSQCSIHNSTFREVSYTRTHLNMTRQLSKNPGPFPDVLKWWVILQINVHKLSCSCFLIFNCLEFTFCVPSKQMLKW